jgi:hypothetical protein
MFGHGLVGDAYRRKTAKDRRPKGAATAMVLSYQASPFTSEHGILDGMNNSMARGTRAGRHYACKPKIWYPRARA